MVQVSLCFNARFHQNFIERLKYNVRFAIKRTSFVFMHEALDVARRGAAAGLRPELLVPAANSCSIVGTPLQVRYLVANIPDFDTCGQTSSVCNVPGPVRCLNVQRRHKLNT